VTHNENHNSHLSSYASGTRFMKCYVHGLGELFHLNLSFLVGYLTTPSLSRLYNVDDMMIDEYGTAGKMGIDGRNRITCR
jgi:hypothetical protein